MIIEYYYVGFQVIQEIVEMTQADKVAKSILKIFPLEKI